MVRRKKSLFRALSFLVVVSILLSLCPVFPPVLKTKAEYYADKRDTVYEGGSNFSDYKGVSRKDCARSYGVPEEVIAANPDELSASAKSKCENGQYGYSKDGNSYIIPLNVEATIDRGYAIYGIP
ncbi:hypothetical protein [Caldicellulosiruptor morganii]|uniref:Uncharacterized protein n=1 Tax=Caldicellulosiruptor morganii TaxID=1387555 RepID=A0ABY7BLT3_9FIRM|nr:hypothetical protein [Caldicellulosiruptor morganii]WAM33803.1 hypothetical protein OTK00_002346 [Caldicellulosiruptor morganii]